MRILNAFFDWLNEILVVGPARKRAQEEEELFQRNLNNLWQKPKDTEE